MTEAWYIDSLDARAGLAFASWRRADLLEESPELDRAAVFLAPPAFRPETLTNRAIGFSAARGGGQLGVFIAEAELAFGTLDALIEFVRRAYVSSGGGDAGGGGGDRPRTPPEPDGGPDLGGGGPEGEVSPAVSTLLAAGTEAFNVAARLQHRSGSPAPAEELRLKAAGGKPAAQGLADGAAELVVEFLRRYPLKDTSRRIVQWAEGAQRLGAAIGGLGLWPEVLGGGCAAVLDGAADQIGRSLRPPAPVPLNRNLIPLLFEPSAPAWFWMQPRRLDDIYYYARRYGLPIPGGTPARPEGDPLDDLGSWPLPADIAPLAGLGQSTPTVFHLIGAISGAPGKLGDPAFKYAAPRAAAVLLFGAAHVFARAEPPAAGSWLLPSLRVSALSDLQARSLEWLLRQWPSLIFPQAVEEIIGSAAALSAA